MVRVVDVSKFGQVLKREFGPLESLEARTKTWMRAEGRLVEAAR